MDAKTAERMLEEHADEKKGKDLQWFFKTGKGQYGQGDIFIGVKVPTTRKIAKQCAKMPLGEIKKLLASPIHEKRLLALLIMVEQFKKSPAPKQEQIFNLYMKSTRFINNWDLVDLSAYHIVGPFLENRPRDVLFEFAQSQLLWERRIAIISTLHYIRQNDFQTTFDISGILLEDKHDLIHKAVGWMLREAGKRDLAAQEVFLAPRYKTMPRTMLRYAIEKFPEDKRQKYLKGLI